MGCHLAGLWRGCSQAAEGVTELRRRGALEELVRAENGEPFHRTRFTVFLPSQRKELPGPFLAPSSSSGSSPLSYSTL